MSYSIDHLHLLEKGKLFEVLYLLITFLQE
nr:MAG TPA: hypothetical protein [Caudoviricetes sp.]